MLFKRYFCMLNSIQMKKYLEIIGIVIIVVLTIALGVNIKKGKKYLSNWETAAANIKAYDELLSDSKNKSATYELTVNQLTNMKDSLLNELNDTRKQLKVKDKNLIAMQNIKTVLIKTDTIHLTDTIFNDRKLNIDTIVGDKWYQANVALKYPSTIIVNPTFLSDKNIIVSTKKETINPPKKLWILRLFQRKHTIINLDVIEKNPYISNQESRYIHIIK